MNQLWHWLSSKPRTHSTKSKRPRVQALGLHLEPLEDRLALAVALNNRVLLVVGTKRADTIRVDLNGANLDVTMNGVVTPGFALAAVDRIAIKGEKGNDILIVGATVRTPASIWGGKGNDILIGGAGDDVLFGEKGDDILVGGDGNDTLFGGRATDILDGGNGNDVVMGEKGVDLLTGGPGNDRILGGEGNDRFASIEAGDTTDFTPGRDKLAEPIALPIPPSLAPPAALPPPAPPPPALPPPPPAPPPPAPPPGTGPLPAVTSGSFTDPGLQGTRTDQVPGAPAISQDHREGPISYAGFSNPPTYGPHHAHGRTAEHPQGGPVQPTGVYSSPLPDEDLLHNLEHGHVWISYNPDRLSAQQRSDLEALVRSFAPPNGAGVGVVLTPRAANTRAISLASWARLLDLDAFDGLAIRNFVIANRAKAPEGFITP